MLAANGYPGAYRKGSASITIPRPSRTNVEVFHAGTALESDRLITSGGRVLAVTAVDRDFGERSGRRAAMRQTAISFAGQTVPRRHRVAGGRAPQAEAIGQYRQYSHGPQWEDGTALIITTTNTRWRAPGFSEYLGIVTGEAIIGANIVKDFLAGIRDIVGGRSGAYEKALRTAREESLRDMATEARARGADAVIGVDLDYEVLGTGNGMLMVTSSGTAVALE